MPELPKKTLKTCERCKKSYYEFEGVDAPHHCPAVCKFIGEVVDGRKVYCRTCNGRRVPSVVPVFACEQFGECVTVNYEPDPDLPAFTGGVCWNCPKFST